MMIRYPQHQGQFDDPDGQLEGCTFRQMQQLGCIQAEHDSLLILFQALMAETHNNPCAGCARWVSHGPACEAFQKFHSSYRQQLQKQQKAIQKAKTPENVPEGHKYYGLTMREIAARLTDSEKKVVSLSEVRRRKLAGTL